MFAGLAVVLINFRDEKRAHLRNGPPTVNCEGRTSGDSRSLQTKIGAKNLRESPQFASTPRRFAVRILTDGPTGCSVCGLS